MTSIHLHLDPLGGMAGDMFIAALLDAYPEHLDAVIAAIGAVTETPCRLISARDHSLTGARFKVEAEPHDHDHHHHDHHHDQAEGGHVAWGEIRARIEAAALTSAIRVRAIDIFSHLAQAEARVHGVPVDEVAFHEVGAEDSIADIIGAATLINAVQPATWSIGALPLGSGLVKTQHGMLPVPAPATAILLEGFATADDGIAGERVTPTGAAILCHLKPRPRTGLTGTMRRGGYGFGTKSLPGRSNVLRVLAFEVESQAAAVHRGLAVINFEVDDQSAEDIGIGLDRLRATPGVHDALQMMAIGKKGRMAAHIQVLARPDALESVVEACFIETTTIGLRTHMVEGRALPRSMHEVAVDGAILRVKRVDRPGGHTGKAEADDLRELGSQTARERHRRVSEALAEGETGHD